MREGLWGARAPRPWSTPGWSGFSPASGVSHGDIGYFRRVIVKLRGISQLLLTLVKIILREDVNPEGLDHYKGGSDDGQVVM